MKKFFILGLLVAGPLSAEQIGNIQYRLPSKNWEVYNELNSERGKAIIYTPKFSQNENQEFFSAHTSSRPAPTNVDEAAIQKSLQPMFPGEDIKVQIFGKDENSLLYRWDTSKIHGLTRVFSGPNGTTLISYHTENPATLQGDNLNQMKATLQDAKLKL